MPKAKRIAIYAGPAWETWDLNTYKEHGIGGAEICAGRLAETAAENGHHVTLYAEVDEKIQHGVHLVPWKYFDPQLESFDLFIASRFIDRIDERLRAKQILVWIHDIGWQTGLPLTPSQKEKIDKYIVLSPWHKQFVMKNYQLEGKKIEIIPHGVNVEIFSRSALFCKKFGKLIWTSSFDRGLENLLYLLPWIIEKVPEVHLEIAYGVFNWKSAAIQSKNHEMMKKIDTLCHLIETTDYVHNLGRLNQLKLARLWQQAYLWIYPTTFTETYCLSAKEAQASGTPILCSNVGALQTTVGNYGLRVPLHPYSKAGRRLFINMAIKILKNRQLWHELSEKAHKGAKNISWEDRWRDYWKKWVETP